MVSYQANMELRIDGVPFPYWETVNIQRAIQTVSTLDFKIPNRFGQFTSKFSKGSSIEFFASYGDILTKVWSGVVDSITRDTSRSGFISAWCRDPLRIFERERTVDDSFIPYPQFSGSYLQMMLHMNNQLSTPLNINSSIADTDFAVVKDFTFETTLQEFTDAATYGGYEWFYSGLQNALVLRPPRELIDENIIKTFILGDPVNFLHYDLANFGFLISDSVTEDYSDEYNWVRCDGLNGVHGIYPTIQPSDVREQYLQSDDWTTSSMCVNAARNQFNEHRFGRISVEIGVPHGQENLEVGDIIQCDDAFYGLSQLQNKIFRIISIDDTFDKAGWTSKIALGDFKPTLSDFL